MGEPLSAAADSAEQWLENWSASASDKLAKAQQMSERVSQATVSAQSPDGSVEVTVSGSGTVSDLRLGEAVRKRPAEEIAQEILRVMRRAQAMLAAKVADIAADTVGADSAAGRAVVASFETRFPTEAGDDADGDYGSATDWRSRGR